MGNGRYVMILSGRRVYLGESIAVGKGAMGKGEAMGSGDGVWAAIAHSQSPDQRSGHLSDHPALDQNPVPALSPALELYCLSMIPLYKSPQGEGLVTQAAAGRHLRVLPQSTPKETLGAIAVCLCEDDYPGWLALGDVPKLAIAPQIYTPPPLDATTIQQRLPQAISFAQAAMAVPNQYLWGGTVAPDYDCSGLIQAAFRSVGIPLPRDAYQQRAFVTAVAIPDLQPGDLLFFAQEECTTHVALALGDGQYLHSSGASHGRNGIGIDSLTDLSHPVSAHYHRQLQGAGRITRPYHPTGIPWPQRNGQPFFT